MSTDSNRLERRAAQRFPMHAPVALHLEGRIVPGLTQDLSARGMFLFTEADLPLGSEVELTFTMPSEITLSDSMPVRCRARVLRSTPTQGGDRHGIAVQLESYEYLPVGEPLPLPQLARISTATAANVVRPAHR